MVHVIHGTCGSSLGRTLPGYLRRASYGTHSNLVRRWTFYWPGRPSPSDPGVIPLSARVQRLVTTHLCCSDGHPILDWPSDSVTLRPLIVIGCLFQLNFVGFSALLCLIISISHIISLCDRFTCRMLMCSSPPLVGLL